jgi:hypothetical protein
LAFDSANIALAHPAGIGNVTLALKDEGMWENTLLFFARYRAIMATNFLALLLTSCIAAVTTAVPFTTPPQAATTRTRRSLA